MNENMLPESARQSVLWNLDTESVALLYHGSCVPTALMLLCSLACAWFLRGTAEVGLLIIWITAVFALTALRCVSNYLFSRASAEHKASPLWRYTLLVCACLSGFLLSVAGLIFVPQEAFMQQLLVLGLLSFVAASASVSYAASFVLFASYASCAFLPVIWLYLSSDSEVLHGLGFLVLIYLAALVIAVSQVNRLLGQALRKRTKDQKLIHSLQTEQQKNLTLNAQLTQQVANTKETKQQFLIQQASLEQSIIERTHELNEALQAWKKSQARLEMALDASHLALWDWDLVSDEVHHTRIKSIFGLENDQVRSVLSDLRPLLHPDDLPVLRNAMIEHMKQRTEGYEVEYRIKHSDGRWVWIEDRGQAIERDAAGRVLRMLGTRRDISERKQHDEKLRLALNVFDAGSEGIVILDPDYIILAVNKAYSVVTGFASEEVIGYSINHAKLPKAVRLQYDSISAAAAHDGTWQGETLGIRKSGDFYPQWLKMHVVRDAEDNITHFVGFFTDITARHQTEERLKYLIQYDELTGLSNRVLFHQRLQQAVEHARQVDGSMALLHIDLDRFKILNNSLGVEVADQVLRIISHRLTGLLLEANTVARLGGNEFAVILDSSVSTSNLVGVATAILAHIRLPIEVAGDELVISASLGISALPDNAREPAALISQASMAMKHAKHLGGDNYQFYNNQLEGSSLERLQLEQQLRRAIEDGQLEAYYQAKLTLADGVVRSAEALARWNHPQRGLVSPAEFITLAEETGLIGAISELMLYQACEQAVLWMQQGMSIRVSVNLSVSHVRQGNLVTLVQQVLDQTGLPAHLLELELTESQLLENAESVIDAFKQLRQIGVHLAIDDFGTGYSSLSYLKRFPANRVKIDQSFISGVAENDEDAAITRAIIAMAHSLNLLVVAEGVETQAQMDFLKEHLCDEVQGYLVQHPVAADVFTEYLIRQKPANTES